MRSAIVLVSLGFILNCSSNSETIQDENALTALGPTGLPCDVEAVVKANCQACHGARPTAGAPMPLRTFEDFHATRNGKPVFENVKVRLHADRNPMPPRPMEAADLSTLDSWLAKGAPRGTDGSCGGTETREVPTLQPLACDGERTVLQASEPFEMKADAPLDQYVCFGVDAERLQKTHLVGFGPKVDNDQILHHILVFQTSEKVDRKPHACDHGSAGGWTMIGGWAPGGTTKEMPPEAGFPEEKGTTHYAVQLHYNNARGLTGAKDQSGMELCSTTKLRANDAGILAFGMLNQLKIPARKAKHKITCDYTWGENDITFFSASPHMHKRGRALRSETIGGAMIADEPKFDFEQQIGKAVSAKLTKGATVRTSCTFENPDDKTVRWGEGTDDEMCFNFMGYYPKQDLAWVAPSIAATNCTEE